MELPPLKYPAFKNDIKMIIYQIRNKVNGKSYVGQAMRGFRSRYSGGKWWNNIANDHLRHSVAKYGYEAFEVIILESNVSSEEELNRLEIEHINKLNCVYPNGYNYQSGGQFIKNRGHNQRTVDKIIATHGLGTHRLLNNRTMQIVEFTNISKFARENGLSVPLLTYLLKGEKYHQHKGWTLPDKPLRRIRFVSPTGEEHIVIDGVDGGIKGFCKRQGFRSTSNVIAMVNGVYKESYGWKAEIIKPIKL